MYRHTHNPTGLLHGVHGCACKHMSTQPAHSVLSTHLSRTLERRRTQRRVLWPERPRWRGLTRPRWRPRPRTPECIHTHHAHTGVLAHAHIEIKILSTIDVVLPCIMWVYRKSKRPHGACTCSMTECRVCPKCEYMCTRLTHCL